MATRILCCLLASLACAGSAIAERRYAAPLLDSFWQARVSAAGCELSHEIPGYGRARFLHPGRGELRLYLHANLALAAASRGMIGAEPPPWQHRRRDRELGQASMQPGAEPLVLPAAEALRLLASLDAGDEPVIRYRDPLGGLEEIEVGLRVARYRDAADEFRACLGSGASAAARFEALRLTPLLFAFDRAELTAETRARLRELAAYLGEGPGVRQVRIAAHTDSRGTPAYNRRLSARRAATVKAFLIDLGVDPSLIRTAHFGEARPALSNTTERGRAANRRAEVELIRDEVPPLARSR